MPFDDTHAPPVRKCEAEIRLIEKLETLLADPRNWCRGAYQRTIGANRQFCLLGGLAHLTGGNPVDIFDGHGPQVAGRVRGRLRRPGHQKVNVFNDTHTHAEVLALLARARESFVAEGFV